MTKRLIDYFAHRHLLANFIVAIVIAGGIFSWRHTSKEEWPDVTFDRVRISVAYPGAPAEDVEHFITKPIEEEIRALDGVYRISSTSSVGQADIMVELEYNYPKVDETATEIKNAVFDVDYPLEVIDDPTVRVFKTAKKAILDVALLHKEAHLLTFDERRALQKYALALESQLLGLPEVNSINRTGYLQEELQVQTHPDKLASYRIAFNKVMNEIRDNHVRKPAGSIEAHQEPKVTLLSELTTVDRLKELVIEGGFEGNVIRLDDVAEVKAGYEKNKEIIKINGHEGVMFNVVKSGSYGILDALDAVNRVVENFRKNNLGGTPIEVVLLDDESIDIRNRLRLVAVNGTIGFLLILATLFIFLDRRSGIWVALGIPFTICFTILGGALLGYSINGTTLAAVIIVMGMVVDDAIVVAENITRMRHKGVPKREAAVKGTVEVMLPIFASIVTTCIAFAPLFFFTGRFGKFIFYIPPIIFLMLGASLFESIFILPGHMSLNIPFLSRLAAKFGIAAAEGETEHWFEEVENRYGKMLERVLPRRNRVFAAFGGLLVLSVLIAHLGFKFVMFPGEETRDIVLMGETAEGATRYETAALTKRIEDALVPYLGKEVVGFRTEIARSRRGGAVEENRFRMIVEIVPKEKRRKSADRLIKEFKSEIDKIEGFREIEFQKSRWGSESGSPIELIVQQNKDDLRHQVVEELVAKMEGHQALTNVEVDEGYRVPEYRIEIDREKIKRLSIEPGDISSTFRAALEGTVLYEFSDGDEDIQLRFTTVDEAKDDIEKVLDLPVENKAQYLVPLRNVVSVIETISPNAISRRDLKRTTIIDADINKKGRMTPLEVAEDFERNVFPKILVKYPTTTLTFGGEVEYTRESKSDFTNAIAMVIFLIYVVLAILFNSLSKPFVIMLAIPFGVVGVVFAFLLHGKLLFGFYAAVGVLGLAGVVINDSIILLDKLEKYYKKGSLEHEQDRQIAQISKTRLRAVVLTTLTTVAGVLPTAYGFAGYDAMLADMMLALAWGLMFGTLITLILVPCIFRSGKDLRKLIDGWREKINVSF